MVRVTHSLVINRPTRAVFDAIVDFEGEPRWQPGLVESKHEPEGPVRTGTLVTQTRSFGGRRIVTRAEVTEIEPERLLIVHSTAENASPAFRNAYRLEPSGAGTRITYTAELAVTGFLRVFSLLVARGLRRDVRARFARLKEQLERR